MPALAASPQHQADPQGAAPAQQQADPVGAAQSTENPTVKASYDEQELRAAPGARDVWAVLEHWIPTVVMGGRLDVGGSATGTQGLFSARGTSWDQNVFLLDGVDLTDPAVRGTSGFFYDYDTLQELTASWGTQPAHVAGPGVGVDMVLRSGADEVHGAAQGYFEVEGMQADNLSDELAAEGVLPASQIDYLSDFSAQIGAPLARGRAWIFGSYRDWRISQWRPGFSTPVLTKLPIFTVKVTSRRQAGDTVSGFWSRQPYLNEGRGASAFVSPEATSIDDTTSNVLAGSWDHPFEGSGLLDRFAVRASYLDIDLSLLRQDGATRQSQFDIVTRMRTGSTPFEVTSSRRRYAVDADLGMSAGDGAHSILAGVQYQYAPTETSIRANDDVNIVTSGGAALLAQLLNTPVANRQNARALGLFLHDDWTPGNRWAVSVGLRYDDWSGSLPAQSSPAGTYAPAREFAAQGGVLGWRALAPRATVSFDVTGDGNLTFLAGFSQYVHQMGTSTLSFGNPNSLGVRLVPWNDANGDGQFQPGEGGGAVSVAGGAAGQIDPDLRAPLTRELRAGAAWAFADDWSAGVDLWYRKDTDLFDDVEVGLQLSDFEETAVRDPGRDNLEFTDDDAGIFVYNQISNFGGNQLLLTTVNDKYVKYRGMDLMAQGHGADWQLRAVLTLGLTQGLSGKSGLIPGDAGGTSDLFDGPNSLINAEARMFWDRPYVLKVYGAYQLPYDINLAGILRSWSGAPLARILPVPLNQGIIDVYAEPRGAMREAALTTGDIRVSKSFGLGGSKDLSLYLDLFNISNAGTVTRTADTFPIFGRPAEIVPPFVARIGARFGF